MSRDTEDSWMKLPLTVNETGNYKPIGCAHHTQAFHAGEEAVCGVHRAHDLCKRAAGKRPWQVGSVLCQWELGATSLLYLLLTVALSVNRHK